MKQSQNENEEVKFGVTKFEFIIGLIVASSQFFQQYYSYYKFSYDLLDKYNIKGVQPIIAGYFGFYKDVSDFQWREFSNILPIFLLYYGLIFSLSTWIRAKHQKNKQKLRNLMLLHFIFTTIMQIYILSVGYLFWITFVILFYFLQKILIKFKYFPIILWSLTVIIIYLNDKYQGYSFEMINSNLKFLDQIQFDNQLIQWQVIFNIGLLRIISFSIDRFWLLTQSKNKNEKPKDLTLKNRVETSLPPQDYNFIHYIGYLTYFPVLLTGPIITFNSFISQMKIPQTTYNKKQVCYYILRVIFCNYLVFEIFLHLNFTNAISKVPENKYLWHKFTQYDQYSTNFVNLMFLWLKFMTIWRIARAQALLDGIETVENMNRCVLNNYCFQQFWRGWHRSFNQWLIRYVFVPLGGNKNRFISIFAVFTFVAIWHDCNINLIVWAWLICIAIIPESAITSYFNKQKYIWKFWWWRYICAFGSIFQINLLIISNCIAFGAGVNTVSESINLLLFTWEGLQVILYFSVVLFFLLAVQFYIRDIQQKKY